MPWDLPMKVCFCTLGCFPCHFGFESGSLDGWTKSGTAFNNQPTYGDNPTARGKGQPANQQGDWWIGSYENRPSPSSPAGLFQDDGPQGTLASPPFTIVASGKMSFLIGGGCDINLVRAELVTNNQVNKCIKDGFIFTDYFVRTNLVQSNTILNLHWDYLLRWRGEGGGERGRVGDPIYGLNSYVPPDRVWFLRVSILYKSIIFSVVGVVFPVWPLGRAPKLYLIRFKCVNAKLEENHHLIPQRIRKGILKAIHWIFMCYY